jgi:hypothetical protein
MATKRNSHEAVRVAQVRQLWQERYSPEERTVTRVLIFCLWLQQYRQDLVPRVEGDPYQHLKVDLKGLTREP